MSAPRAYCIATRRGALLKEGPLLLDALCGAELLNKWMQLPSCYETGCTCRVHHPLADGRALRLCSEWRELIETGLTSCPVCHSANTRRSKRRTVLDYLFAFSGLLPWRCEACAARFYSRLLPFRTLLYAHCRICGNLELQRISAERITGATSFAGRLLGIQALRCAPCRHKFFSVRPLHREEHPVASAPNKQRAVPRT